MATRILFTRRDSALVEQRDEPRHRVDAVRATADVDAEQPFATWLANISSFGCRLAGVPALEPNTRLWLHLPGAPPVLAVIAWVQGDEAGCRFEAPISQTLMRALLPGAV